MQWSINCTLLVKFPRSLHDISPTIALNQCHSSIRKLRVEAIRVPLVRHAILANQYTVGFFVITFSHELFVLCVHHAKGKGRLRTENTVFFRPNIVRLNYRSFIFKGSDTRYRRKQVLRSLKSKWLVILPF